MSDVRLPQTDREWQDAVDLAHSFLAIEAARAYGFITGGPRCNVDRCDEIFKLGKERGFTPADDAIERTMREMLQPDV